MNIVIPSRFWQNRAMSEYSWINPQALFLLHEQTLLIHGGVSGVRDQRLLESALMRPQNTALQNTALYNNNADIADLCASYAYGIAKNHPFTDGNKRAAFLCIGLFLGNNGYRLTAGPVDAINVVIGVADGYISEEKLASWIRDNIEPLPAVL